MFEWRILYDFSICHVKLLVYTANNTCQWIILYKKLKSNLNRREYYCTRNICEFFFFENARNFEFVSRQFCIW